MPLWLVNRSYVDKQRKPFVRQAWFNGHSKKSQIDGNGQYTLFPVRTRGISGN